MGARLPVVLVCGWALIALAWVFANPPFAAPDEGSHYLRAVGIGDGALIGQETPARPPGQNERQVDWQAMSVRVVAVPARLAPPDAGCYILDATRSAACIEAAPAPATDALAATPVGTYQPLPYLLPAVGVRLGSGADQALRWGRLAGLLPALALLATAVAVLWDPRAGALSLLGLVAAVAPMVLFCAASLTGSGLEIAAGVAFIAALLRLARDARHPSRVGSSPWVWAAAGETGAILALSRSASPVWVASALVLWLGLLGPRAGWRLVRDRRAAWVAAAAVFGGIALNRVWEQLYGPRSELSIANGRQAVRDGVDQFGRTAHELVFGPGYLEYALPIWGSLMWLALLVALVAAALVAAVALHERVVLLLTAIGVPLVPIALYVLTIRFTGFGIQGRHVLPIVVALPLLAGELVREGRDRVPASVLRALVIGIPIAAAVVHLLALWRNAQRSAFGLDQTLLGWAAPEWSPPAGWTLWFMVASAGCALLAATALQSRSAVLRSRPRG
jgi:Predicted membrane protein (DUF2142)